MSACSSKRSRMAPAADTSLSNLPHSSMGRLEVIMVERDEKGFIKTGHAVVNAPAWKGMSRSPGPLETSWPGIFAAGDVRSGSVKRCAAAVGEGGMAVEGVHEVLKTYA